MKKFGKLLGVILAFILVLSVFSACGAKDTSGDITAEPGADFEKLKAEYQSKTAEDLISENIKDRANPTDEEIVALVKTGAYANTNEKYLFEENITEEALDILSGENVANAYVGKFTENVINDENAGVRAYLYNLFSSYVPLDDEELENILIEKIKTETETFVIANALNGLKNALSERGEFVDFAISFAEHEDATIRYYAASAISYYRLEDNEKCVDAMIKLMSDSDTEVANLACREAGSFGNEKIIAPIEAILADESLVDLHGPATDSLEELWMNYPFYENSSEAAYRAHLAYLNSDSENPEIPSWLAISSITDGNGDSFEEWKANSTYFNASELVAALTKIVSDKSVDQLAKTTAIKKIGSFGTAADLEALKPLVAGDEDESSLISAIDSELASK